MKEVVNKQTLILGDSLKVLKELDKKFDACITDPPYNISGYDDKKEIGWYKSNGYWKDKKKFNKINEILAKCLCHNLCCLIQEAFELGIELDFKKCAKYQIAHK